MSNYSDRELHAAGHLLREWRRAAAEDNLTGEERLDTLAAFLRAILDHGDGTWTFPPLKAADLMAMPDAEFEQRQRDTGMESQVRVALVRTPETLDVDALVASLPAVRRRTDAQPMIPESAVRRLLTTLAAAQSPAPPEGLRFAEISDPIAGSRVVFDAASPAPPEGLTEWCVPATTHRYERIGDNELRCRRCGFRRPG